MAKASDVPYERTTFYSVVTTLPGRITVNAVLSSDLTVQVTWAGGFRPYAVHGKLGFYLVKGVVELTLPSLDLCLHSVRCLDVVKRPYLQTRFLQAHSLRWQPPSGELTVSGTFEALL